MATVVSLTQIQVGTNQPGPGTYLIEGSETSLSLNQVNIIGVAEYWDPTKLVYLDARLVFLDIPVNNVITVTDDYTTIVGYITANP
tara:strand:+ start:202 stop:459 length:258 start_codon:yes stop_codon:yes gene_type:complete